MVLKADYPVLSCQSSFQHQDNLLRLLVTAIAITTKEGFIPGSQLSVTHGDY